MRWPRACWATSAEGRQRCHKWWNAEGGVGVTNRVRLSGSEGSESPARGRGSGPSLSTRGQPRRHGPRSQGRVREQGQKGEEEKIKNDADLWAPCVIVSSQFLVSSNKQWIGSCFPQRNKKLNRPIPQNRDGIIPLQLIPQPNAMLHCSHWKYQDLVLQPIVVSILYVSLIEFNRLQLSSIQSSMALYLIKQMCAKTTF